MSCPFCGIAAEVARWDDKVACDWGAAFALRPLNPVCDGHILIVPRRHVTHAAEDPAVAADAFRCAAIYAAGRGAYNLITSAGAPATQTVEHLHIHFVPRSEGDGLHLPWTGQVARP